MGGFANIGNTAAGMKWGMGLEALGGFFNAYSQYQQGTAEQDMYNFQADQILMQAQSESEMVRRRGDRILSSQRAAMAASGMSLDSVTADDIAYSTEKDIALDELMIKYNAQLESWQARQAGKNAKKAARIQAFNTLVGTAQQMSDSWYEWKKTSQGKSRTGKLQGKNVNVNYKNRYGNIG
jgi:hypothetical protein